MFLGYNLAISSASLGLFQSSSGFSSSGVTSIDLSGVYAARSNPSTASLPKTLARMAPWDANAPKTTNDKLAAKALASNSLFSGGLGQGAGSGIAAKNDRELFLLHNAVEKLKALADVATTRTLSDSERSKFQDRIARGLKEIEAQAKSAGLEGATLLTGRKYTSLSSGSFGQTKPTSFSSQILTNGDANTVPEQFAGVVMFDLKISTAGGDTVVNLDLAEMGGTTRTVENVANYINSKLSAAGVEARFSREEVSKASTIKGGPATLQQRFKISIAATETLSFLPVAGATTETAIYVAGAKTVSGVAQSVISRIDVSATNSIEKGAVKNLSAANGGANVRAMTHDLDGNIYFIADSTGQVGTSTPKDRSDVVLQKQDSSGRIIWSRSLGSAAPANGFSIAVDIDGTIAIAGTVDGKIENSANVSGEGVDSFIATFDADGKDLWFKQNGALGADKAVDIAFDSTGNLLVLGQTTNSIGGSSVLGGTDVYIQSYDTDGLLNYSKSIGTTGNDTPVSIAINGANAYVAWNDATSGRISNLDTTTGNFNAADFLASSQGLSKISGFALDDSGNAIISAANTGSSISDQLRGYALGTGTQIFAADMAGNVIRTLNVEGNRANIALDGAKDENAANPNAYQTLLKSYNTATGSLDYSAAALGEITGNVAITSVSAQSTALQAMGLPQGELSFDNATSLTDLTGLRVGDSFYIASNGGAKRKISIVDGETVQSLVNKMNKFTSTFATTALLSRDGAKYLTLTPKAGAKVEIIAGEGVTNALKELGLDAGTAIATNKSANAPPVIALELPTVTDISDKAKAKVLTDLLDGVMRRIRLGYRAVSQDPTQVELRRLTAQGANKNNSNSAAIAAYSRQTAAMQDALIKLGG